MKRTILLIAMLLIAALASTVSAASASAETCSTNWFGSGPTINSSNDAAATIYSPSCTLNFVDEAILEYKGLDNQWHGVYNGSSHALDVFMASESCGAGTTYDANSHNTLDIEWDGTSCSGDTSKADAYDLKPKNKAPSQGSGSLLPICQWPFRVHENRDDGSVSNSSTTAATC